MPVIDQLIMNNTPFIFKSLSVWIINYIQPLRKNSYVIITSPFVNLRNIPKSLLLGPDYSLLATIFFTLGLGFLNILLKRVQHNTAFVSLDMFVFRTSHLKYSNTTMRSHYPATSISLLPPHSISAFRRKLACIFCRTRYPVYTKWMLIFTTPDGQKTEEHKHLRFSFHSRFIDFKIFYFVWIFQLDSQG